MNRVLEVTGMLLAVMAWTLLIALVAVGVGMCSGCGPSARAIARSTLTVTATAVLEVDQVTASEYREAAAHALSSSASLAEYHTSMGPWDQLEESLRAVRGALLTADLAIEAWDAGGSGRWLELAACIAGALVELRGSLEAVGLDVPPELGAAVGQLGGFAGSCPGGA